MLIFLIRSSPPHDAECLPEYRSFFIPLTMILALVSFISFSFLHEGEHSFLFLLTSLNNTLFASSIALFATPLAVPVLLSTYSFTHICIAFIYLIQILHPFAKDSLQESKDLSDYDQPRKHRICSPSLRFQWQIGCRRAMPLRYEDK